MENISSFISLKIQLQSIDSVNLMNFILGTVGYWWEYTQDIFEFSIHMRKYRNKNISKKHEWKYGFSMNLSLTFNRAISYRFLINFFILTIHWYTKLLVSSEKNNSFIKLFYLRPFNNILSMRPSLINYYSDHQKCSSAG